jgi:serine/threonine protein kinase
MGCGGSKLDVKYNTNKSGNLDTIDELEPTPIVEHLSYVDFTVEEFIQTGGVGKVFSGRRNIDCKPFAFKFFGYTSKMPLLNEINKEINFMVALQGIHGIVQIEGIFMDLSLGYVGGKFSKASFPVIVMEMLEGGELFERIIQNQSASENVLSKIFKSIVETLNEVHRRGFIHRDLKLENIMYANKSDDSPVKIIDFGMMVKLPKGQDVYMGIDVQGTPGYVAPESITDMEFSAKTDLFQAGCCLYAMLSGYMAFDPDNLDQVTHGTYKAMTGKGWAKISDDAKNLISRILEKDKTIRISGEEILRHPWIVGDDISNENLDASYFSRIKGLALRQKLRTFFVESNIQETNKKRRASLMAIIPYLQNNSASTSSDDETDPGTPTMQPRPFLAADMEAALADPKTHAKLKKLKGVILNAMSPFAPQRVKVRQPPAAEQVDSDRSGDGKTDILAHFAIYCEMQS